MPDFRFSRPLLAAAMAGSALLAGCATVPDLGAKPVTRAPADYAAERSLNAAPDATWPAERWWAAYGDPQLDTLITEALAGSPDLAAAAARLRRARGITQQAGAARSPRVDLDADAALAKQSYNNYIPADFLPRGWNDTGQVALNLGFDLDLWGRNRAALRAATSEAEAARIEVAEAALALSTNIADAYAELSRLHAERAVQAEALSVRERTRGLVVDRVAAGLDTRAEQKQADAGVPAARAELAAIDERIALTRNRIAALIGAGPDRGLSITPPAASVRARGLPAGVTTDLIGRRPDIAAARARVEAAASRIKVARADFYPAVSLGALIGLQSFGLGQLIDRGSTFGQVGPAVSLPIFRGGELQGRYRGARAEYDEAVALYDRAVADAYREVADAVTSRRALDTRLAEQREALSDSEQAYAVARQRFEGGLSTFLDVLTAEDRALGARRTVADLDARAFALDVALVRALGGGFSAPAMTDFSKDDPRG